MTRGQRVLVMGAGGVLAGLASAYVARRVGAPGEATAVALLLGLGFGAFFASRILASLGTAAVLVEEARALGEGAGGAGAPPAPTPLTGTPGDLGEWLSRREDLALFAPEEVAAFPGVLEAGERVRGVGLGVRDGRGGLLAVTDRRLLFLRKGGGVDAFALPSLTSAHVREGTVLSTLTVEHAEGQATFEVAASAVGGVAGALGVPVRTSGPAPPAPEPFPTTPLTARPTSTDEGSPAPVDPTSPSRPPADEPGDVP
ncbi:MAG TPA: hypothetical protein VNO79_16870 [Actinomycetota bacterium]|nr:hypothetical protein [Actinomycetota bacterium]